MYLLQLLLDSEITVMSTFPLPAVGSTGVEASVALSADHLLAVVLGSQSPHTRLNDSWKLGEGEEG